MGAWHCDYCVYCLLGNYLGPARLRANGSLLLKTSAHFLIGSAKSSPNCLLGTSMVHDLEQVGDMLRVLVSLSARALRSFSGQAFS